MLREYAAARGRGRAAARDAAPPPRALRLLPISGGIFAGAHRARMPSMTRAALARAFEALPDATRCALAEDADDDAAGARIEARNHRGVRLGAS